MKKALVLLLCIFCFGCGKKTTNEVNCYKAENDTGYLCCSSIYCWASANFTIYEKEYFEELGITDYGYRIAQKTAIRRMNNLLKSN